MRRAVAILAMLSLMTVALAEAVTRFWAAASASRSWWAYYVPLADSPTAPMPIFAITIPLEVYVEPASMIFTAAYILSVEWSRRSDRRQAGFAVGEKPLT